MIMDATSRIKDVLTVSTRFVELLTEENDALRGKHPEKVANLVEDKAIVSRAYETLVTRLTEEPDNLKATAPDLRERMRALGEKLQILIDENVRLLTAAIDVNRRVLQIAADAAKQNQPGPTTYSAMGTMAAASGGASPSAVPMSVNRSL